MFKVVILMLLIGVLALLFGDVFLTLILGVTTGGSYVLPVIGMFTQFIGSALSSMFAQPYIMNLIYVFLFLNIILVVVQFIRKGTASYFQSVNNEEESKEDEFDTETSSHSTYYGGQEIERYTVKKTWKTSTKNGKRRRYLIDTSKDIDFKED